MAMMLTQKLGMDCPISAKNFAPVSIGESLLVAEKTPNNNPKISEIKKAETAN